MKTVEPRAPLYIGARYDAPVSPNQGCLGTQVQINILGFKAPFSMVAITTIANTKERGSCILTLYLKKTDTQPCLNQKISNSNETD